MHLSKPLSRAAFGALALFLTVSLPLRASAAGEDGDTIPVRSAQVLTQEGTFLGRVYAVTDHGRPAQGTTRAQYVTLLYQAAGAPEVTARITFTDVAPDADYAPALAWAEERGILLGDPGGAFYPDRAITGESAADLLCRAVAALGETTYDVAASILAAYTGKSSEESLALLPEQLGTLLCAQRDPVPGLPTCGSQVQGVWPARRPGSCPQSPL